LQRLLNKRIGARRQPRIGVQEKKRIAARHGGADVHLRRAAFLASQKPVTHRSGQFRGAVRAAAVDDDHLVAAAAQRCERLQRLPDARRLVQRGDDDRKSLSAQSYSRKTSFARPAASASAPSNAAWRANQRSRGAKSSLYQSKMRDTSRRPSR
jgi:hypothetical protein